MSQRNPTCPVHGVEKQERTEYDVTAYVCPICRDGRRERDKRLSKADEDATNDEDTVATDGRGGIKQKYQLDDPDIRIKITCQQCGDHARHLVRHDDDDESTETVCLSCGHHHTYPARIAATRLASNDTAHNHVPGGGS